MTTIAELQQVAIDLEYRVHQELENNASGQARVTDALDKVRDSIQAMSDAVEALNGVLGVVFVDRASGLSATIGAPPTAPANGG